LVANHAQARTISLNGDWSFVADPGGKFSVLELARTSARPARVPGSWQADFADLRDYAGVAWYWRSFDLEAPGPHQSVLLHFGALDYKVDAFVNGQKAGSHEGGYLPFEFDVTELLRAGKNQLALRVADSSKGRDIEGIKYAEIPHGKQDWYVETSGPWQGIDLRIVPRIHLLDPHIRAGADGAFEISATIVNPAPTADGQSGATAGATKLRVEIYDSAMKVVWNGASDLKPGQTQCEFSGRVSNPALWSPATPVLYTLVARLGDSADAAKTAPHAAASTGSLDIAQTRFAFRTIQTFNGKFFLNHRLIYLRGALDQDFYPETIYTTPSFDYLKSQMQKAKTLGFNLLRCHIKIPDPRYLEAADEVGMLVWYEIPNWDRLTPSSERRALETLQGMIERDWNHPSIVIVSLINEAWGVNLKESTDRQWLKQTWEQAKKWTPGWLVEDNSPCCDNFHVETDLADFHTYQAIPDHASDFDRLIGELAARPKWLFSPYGDAAPRGDEPLLLSEFGGWGLARVPAARPFWFTRDFRANPITLPEGFEKRFADYQYATLFPDLDALLLATQQHEYQTLKYEIETLRLRPEIQGYVITQFTDVNWESNGLLDMWRNPKAFGRQLAQLQQDDLVIVRPAKYNFLAGDQAEADLHFSHLSPVAFQGGQVNWTVDGTPLSGHFGLPPVPTGSVTALGKIKFSVPAEAANAPARHLLKVEAVAGGHIISQNSVDIYFYPAAKPELPPSVSFEDPKGKLRRLVNEMHSRGYQAPVGGEQFPVSIASVFNDRVKQALAGGGRVILLTSDPQTLAPGIEIKPRAGTDLDGDWISGFAWVRGNHAPFRQLAFDKLVGFETQAVIPGALVEGIPSANFSDVLSGIFYGWIQASAGTLVQARYGKGKLLICTYSLAGTYNNDPFATYLLDALVSYASGGFAPGFEIPR
jgi:hypothetical protein